MMTTITKDVGRGDFLLHKYSDERVGVLWQEDVDGELVGKDLSGWKATLTLQNNQGKTIHTQKCICFSDGYVCADIPYSTFNASQFVGVTSGRWRIVGTYKSSTELIGAGNFALDV